MRKIFLKIEKRRSIKTITKYLGENILLRFCGVFSKIIFFIVSFLLFNPSNINAQQNINGLSFDGNNDFISLGNSSLLKPTSALTIESWLYLNSWNQAGTQTIISTYDTAGYSLVVQNGQLIGSLYRNGTTATVTYNVSSYTGWHHVALYFNGQYLRLYTDGSLRSTNNAGATYSIGYNPLLNVFIGASPVDTSNFLNGVIDEIRIWSTARTISTSSVHYEVLPTTTGLIAYYRLNQGIAGYDNTSITEIVDLTSNSLNGFLNNFLLTGSTSNFVEGKALKPINTSSSLTPIDNQLTQFTISWIRPGENKGGNGVKVFVREGVTSGSAAPVDGTDYNANSIFKSGDQIGTTGWYCVYDGNDTFTTVYGLNPSTTYRIHVIEYQELSGQPIRYSTATATNNPRNTYTLFTPPSMQASGITFSNINGTSFTINWTRGNGSNCIVFLKQADDGSPIPVDRTTYTANSRFKSGTQIGTTGWYCVYKGTGTSVNVTYLTAGQTYRAKVIEFNGVTGFESYYILDTISNPLNQIPDYFTPSVPASNVSFSNMNGTSITVSWTKGDGSYTIVFAKKTALADSAQPTNNTTYTASATFGSGTQIGSTGWYCVYKGTGTYVNVAGLTAGQTYAFMAITFNGTSGYEKYLTGTSANNPNYQLMDYVVPVTQASNIVISNLAQRTMTVSFTRGSGSYRIVFIKQGTDGTVTLNNNTTYTANASFGSGSTDGYGWYCVYKGTGTSVNVSNLTPLTDYRVMVCEYNGIAGFEKYNTTTSTNNPINTTTIDYSAPTIQASNLNFTNIYSNRYTVSWTRGNGSSCIVFAKKTSDTLELPSPDDNVTYTANATFGSGTQIGTSGWYCIYKGTGTLVTMTGLTADSTYRIMVC